jgi:AdoMet-dependent heme synthase
MTLLPMVPSNGVQPGPNPDLRPIPLPPPPLRMVFWETTKGCNLSCQHCRAVPQLACGPGDLTTRQAFDLIDRIAEVSKPVMVLSGGEPLYRPDIFLIGSYGRERGFRMALATNGTLVDRDVAAQIAKAGFARVSISLDGARSYTHDHFRGLPGAYERAMRGIRYLRDEGVSIQINSTIAKHNVEQLPEMLEVAKGVGADALHIFMLVPVGCGLELAESQMLPADQYERVLNWFYDQSKTCTLDLKATCAPHYFRVRAQRIIEERRQGDRSTPFIAPGTKAKAAPDPAGGRPLSTMTRGCLAGTAVCFVSNEGEVYPCGYLPVSAGNVRRQPFNEIWRAADVFLQLRDPDALNGKCGVCRYVAICGGCRARAYGSGGDYLDEEPFCTYDPYEDAGYTR